MTGGYNSEERKPLVSNFNDKEFHHNTMGLNASVAAQDNDNSPINIRKRESIDHHSLDQDGMLVLPSIQNMNKGTLSPVPSVPSIA